MEFHTYSFDSFRAKIVQEFLIVEHDENEQVALYLQI